MTNNKDNDSSAPTDTDGAHPTRIGPYQILDVLGEGGMAFVYLAEQSEPVKRRVALKILKPGMDSKQVVARFESERQALAVLDHPNIAKIFDGGLAENGRPYFAMEHVQGATITDYCDQQRLSTEDRLALFVDVCHAVQHAHLKGLIHRDLKPSNILVAVGIGDSKPQPKIIDFGIAKATTLTLTEATLFTRIGQAVGTPQYMSPEQAGGTGLDIDTRTDVYSLGIILYELLVGAAPIDFQAIGEQAIRAAITQKDPPKPSTRITQLGDSQVEIAKARRTDIDGLRRKLSGDLDWIVMRAIEKDRTRRYETTNALAMDCRRHLDDEPILARPPSAGYLLSRFVRRNRTVVAAASIAILAIFAGSAAAISGYLVAVREAATAREVSEFLVELFEVSDPSEARGNSITAREILDQGARSIEYELSGQPAVQAELLETIGSVYYGLGLYGDAIALLEKAQRLSTDLYDADDPRRTKTDQTLGLAYSAANRFDEAEPLLLATLERDTRNFGRESRRVAYLHEVIANLYSRLDRLEEAERYALESLSISTALYGGDSVDVARSLDALARVERELGKYDAGLEHAKQALTIFDRLLPADDPLIARSLTEISLNLSEQGLLEEQEPYVLRALEIDEKVYGTEHDAFATSLENVGILFAKQGKLEQAEDYFQRALATSEAALGPVHDSVAFRNYNLGFLYGDMQQYEKAEPHLRRSIAIWTEVFGPDHGSNGWAWNSLAQHFRKRGMLDEANDAAARALAINEDRYGPDHQNTAAALHTLANVARDQGRHADARRQYERSLAINEAIFGASSPRTTRVLEDYVVFLDVAGSSEEADAARRRLSGSGE